MIKKFTQFFLIVFTLAFPPFLNSCIYSGGNNSSKSYSIYMNDNNLSVVMEHPTYGIVELNRPDWKGVKLEEVAEDIYNHLQQSKINGEFIIWVQFMNTQTDKYGNITTTYEDYEIGRIPSSEARKYKSWEYLDENYQLTNNIRKAAFDPNYKKNIEEDPYDHISEGYIAPTDTITL